MPILNDPQTVAELTRLHDAYEVALVSNDVAALKAFFWDSPHAVRFGVKEQLYGAEAIAAFRATNTTVYRDRALLRRTILIVGTDVASVMSEYAQNVNHQPALSRQSQTWVKFPESGWKIVTAHVSNGVVSQPS